MRKVELLVLCMLLLVGPGAAWALPFNSDMVGDQLITGESMRPKVPNTVPVGSLDRQIKNREEALKLKNPLAGDPEAALAGKRLFEINCAVCHGTFAKGQQTFPALMMKGMPAINLLDPTIAAKPDGHFFGYPHFGGGAIMPAYGWKFTNDELWQIVTYIRELQAEAKAPLGTK